MNGNPLRRQSDTLTLPEGNYFEVYTPIVGRIKSTALNASLQYAKMILSATASVTFRDRAGVQSTFTLPAGPQPFFVTEISAAGTAVAIVHDGQIWSQDTAFPDMTANFITV